MAGSFGSRGIVIGCPGSIRVALRRGSVALRGSFPLSHASRSGAAASG
jgi:hypothetical protein